jgi:formylglycine-generating enzyme required for sulfatase activity
LIVVRPGLGGASEIQLALTPIVKDVTCLEPIPLMARSRPPVIPDRVDLKSDHGLVMVSDVYQGPGLKGVPRGTITALRLIEPYYHPHAAPNRFRVPGVAGPWDMRRIVGTVPVEADGSASWKAPANIPLSIQALDAQGQAVAIMRSWYTAMPGEKITCIGCHEGPQAAVSLGSVPLAARRPPSVITPWRGPARGFAFLSEVQPVLDRHCISCHDGKSKDRPGFASVGEVKPAGGWRSGPVAQSYLALQAFVRRPGPESNLSLPLPMEWHADTSDLVQMLRKGHHGVKLDTEAWDRLITWIDLNVPFHATYGDHPSLKRRHELWAKYATPRESLEILPPRPTVDPLPPPTAPAKPDQHLSAPGWPFPATQATHLVTTTGLPSPLTLDLGGGVNLRLVLIPAGSFVMGSREGYDDEYPQAVVTIERPFYLGETEITNAQYACFDAQHDSGFFSQYGYFQSYRGSSARDAEQPVIRISWHQARAFCTWLGQKTGRGITLPSEAQWEWACRAGSATAMWYGGIDAPWTAAKGRLDNLADADLIKSIMTRWPGTGPPAFMPHDGRQRDGGGFSIPAQGSVANPFGLVHMHGNVREWTRSLYRPYPYQAQDGREDLTAEGRRVVRGGSFYDLPKRATASHRLGYVPWMKPWNVGFRVVCEVSR